MSGEIQKSGIKIYNERVTKVLETDISRDKLAAQMVMSDMDREYVVEINRVIAIRYSELIEALPKSRELEELMKIIRWQKPGEIQEFKVFDNIDERIKRLEKLLSAVRAIEKNDPFKEVNYLGNLDPEPATNSAEYWDKIWAREGLDTWRRYPTTFKRITELIPKQATVLDVGCGNGLLIKEIAVNHKSRIWGIDCSQEAIKQLQTAFEGRSEIVGMVGQVPPLPVADKSFNVITASEFLEHFKDPESVVKEFARVADCCIVAVPDNILGNEICPEHHQKFDETSLRKLMEKYFEYVEIEHLTDQFDQYTMQVLICKALGGK